MGTQVYNGMVSAKFANMSLLSAFMVVSIHVFKRNQEFGSTVWWFRQFMGEGLCRIAVPYFFLVAGYFLARHFKEVNWWRSEATKRIRTLIVPFLTWCLICFLLSSMIIIVKNYHDRICWYEGLFTRHRLLIASGLNPFSVPELRQLWFVRVLFCLVLISPFLRCIASWRGVLLLWMLWVMGKFVWPEICSTRWWMFLNFGLFSFEGALFFTLGIRLRMSNFNWLKISRRFALGALIVGCLILVVKVFAVYLMIPFVHCLACLYIPLFLIGILGVMPCFSMHGVLQKVHFPLYLIHLNVIFIYFALLSCVTGSDVVAWIDPGLSCRGVMVCFALASICSLLVFAALHKLSFDNRCLRTALWGGRL